MKDFLSLNLRIESYKKFSKLISKKQLLAALFIIKIVLLALEAISPIFYKILVDDVLINKDITKLIFVCVGYIAVFIFSSLFIVLNKTTSNKLLLKFTLKLKIKLLRIFTKMISEKYEQYEIGDLKNRVDNDTSICVNFISSQIIDYVFNWLNVIVFSIVIACINIKLSLFGFLMIPVSFLLTKVLAKKANKVSSDYREVWGEYEGYIHGTMQNFREIKALNVENAHEKKFTKYWDKLSDLFVKRQIYWYLNRGFIAFKDFFVTKMNLYFIGGLLIFSGEMTVGSLLVFMVYYEKLFSNIGAINDLDIQVQQDVPAIKKVIEILDIKLSSTKKYKLEKINGDIKFEDVSFSYDNNDEVTLKNINLCISPEENVAIVGKSGCGKSTLSKLILNIYEPKTGKVTINNIDINKYNQTSFHSRIGIVSQEPYMFNLTIRENLLLAKPNSSDEELHTVCKKAYIDEFIESLQKGLDTIIGERGIKLSGGQKQRLAIARTLLSNTDIIIFDEATSALDYESEKMIHKTIEELCAEKTIIIIAHRLSSILLADKVVVMDNGEIVGQGKNDELLGCNEVYDRLFKEQYNTALIN
jgi:ABC-type bacteriocin/lantibiotic exporter with double-glycine peptidase domain